MYMKKTVITMIVLSLSFLIFWGGYKLGKKRTEESYQYLNYGIQESDNSLDRQSMIQWRRIAQTTLMWITKEQSKGNEIFQKLDRMNPVSMENLLDMYRTALFVDAMIYEIDQSYPIDGSRELVYILRAAGYMDNKEKFDIIPNMEEYIETMKCEHGKVADYVPVALIPLFYPNAYNRVLSFVQKELHRRSNLENRVDQDL